MNFEIKYKDARGRAGILKTPHGNIKTPALMPVIHPGKQTLDVKKFGAEIVITNAYIIYKNKDLRVKALEDGVHSFINFSGPIVTDSGSFQLSEYGDIHVSNRDIIEFQEKIGTDIGTSLDIPTPPFVSRKRALNELDITIRRAKEALEVRDKLMLNSVVQGSTFPDLRARCAQTLGDMEFDVYPIGAVVPLMESYQYSSLLDVVMASVENLPDSRPRHLMGAGHPMIFAFAVALGCDLFDSAAYILYAQDDRLLMPDGTYKLENLVEMPCSCEVCSNYTPEDLRNMKKVERTKLLAQHNLQVSFAEIRHIRQALSEGSLWELVEERCKTHPYLLDALRNVKKYTKNLEKYDPPYKKSAFFYSGPESLNRPEVHRHLKLLERLPQKKRLLILPSSEKPYSKHISPDINIFYSNTKKQDLDEVIISAEVLESWDLSLDPKFEYYYNQPLKIDVNDERRIKYIVDYQFGRGTGEALFKGDIKIVKSKKTGKIRHIYHDDHLLANLRASDGVLVMGKKGALRLHRYLPYPQNRVVVNEEAEPFAMEGKSIFAKFVIDCDVNIKASEEVLIVNQKDELLAFGKSILCAREIMDFNTGQAVKTRKGGF